MQQPPTTYCELMPTSTNKARNTMARMQGNSVFRRLARGGYAVNGLLHILIGVIALGIAFGSGGQADQGGALSQLRSSPGGGALLWTVATGLSALGLFQMILVAQVPGNEKESWGERAKEGGKGIAYLAVAWTAASSANGSSADSSTQTQSFSAHMLATPGGVFLLVLVGLAVLAVGIHFVVKGVKQSFLSDISMPSGAAGRATVSMGTVGYIAKGVALAVVGVLFAVAALTLDASEATGLDGALKTLAGLPLGEAILTAVALGLIAYGTYCFVRARYARLGGR